MHIENEPIAYDDHGCIPFDVPFSEIRPEDISIYLQLNTKVGPRTCGQTCRHCFYINQPEAANQEMDLREGRRVMDDLALRGYRVFPMISDSFANDGEFLRRFGNTHNRNFRQEIERRPTKIMERGDMWTSGAALMTDKWRDLLCLGMENGFGNVTITFHGTLDEELRIRPRETYPISGVFHAEDCEEVIRRIHAFNADLVAGRIDRLAGLPPEARAPLLISIGLTIGQHNNTKEHLLRYVAYFNKQGVSVLRFNAFHDHGWRLPHLPNSPDDIARCFRDLKWIHDNVPLNFQLGVDEDWGTDGIEVLGLPAHTGWCRAGRQLFAVVPCREVVLSETEVLQRVQIGNVAGCVDAFKPIVGQLVRDTSKLSGVPSYDLVFFDDVIADLNRKRTDGIYTNGCFAGEMLAELRQNAAASRRRQHG